MNSQLQANTKTTKSISVFEWADDKHAYLKQTLEHFLQEPDKSLVSRSLYLSHQIQKGCEKNTTGILAALQLNRTHVHKHTKELFVAVLCELIAKDMGIPASSRLYICCAALTHDLGMLELQNESLDHQSAPLSPEQKRKIDKHLETGQRILKNAGVAEPIWLNTVLQHHERPDGKGYHQGLSGDDISIGARILHVADAYVALLRPRADRPPLAPKDAMREIFLRRGKSFDEKAARSLVQILTMFPPGTWVRLANGEIGVVSRVHKNLPFQHVVVVIDAEGAHMESPLERNTETSSNTIIETVDAPFHMNLTSILNSIWTKIEL